MAILLGIVSVAVSIGLGIIFGKMGYRTAKKRGSQNPQGWAIFCMIGTFLAYIVLLLVKPKTVEAEEGA